VSSYPLEAYLHFYPLVVCLQAGGHDGHFHALDQYAPSSRSRQQQQRSSPRSPAPSPAAAAAAAGSSQEKIPGTVLVSAARSDDASSVLPLIRHADKESRRWYVLPPPLVASLSCLATMPCWIATPVWGVVAKQWADSMVLAYDWHNERDFQNSGGHSTPPKTIFSTPTCGQ
jgi:hypothetical protein